MLSKLKLSSVTGSLGLQMNTGVFQVSAQLGLAADRTLDVLESAKGGVSVCNIGDDMLMLEAAVGKFLQVQTESAKKIRDVVETIPSHASMLQAHEMTTVECFLNGHSDAGMVLLSVLFSTVAVLGREAAVTVTRCFIEKLAAADGDTLNIDQFKLENIFRTLIRDLEAGGNTWLTTKSQTYDALANTDGKEIFSELRFAEVTYGMMVSLIWWLYQSVKVGHDGQRPQACKSYDTRLHKVVYLLKQFGWPVHAAWSWETDEDLAHIPRVMFEAYVCGEEVEDLPLLQAHDVDRHSLNVPAWGSRMVCKYEDIGKVLRARVGSNNYGIDLEGGWESGWKRAMSTEFRLLSHEVGLECHARVVVPFHHGEIGTLLKMLQTNLAETVHVLTSQYEDYFSWSRTPYLYKKDLGDWNALQRSELTGETKKMGWFDTGMVGFLLGYLCGSIFQLSVKLGLTIKDDVTLSWLGNIRQFLQDLDDAMAGFYVSYTRGGAYVLTHSYYKPVDIAFLTVERTEASGVTIGRCLDLIAVCFYGEAQRLGDIGRQPKAEEYNIVGTLTGDKLLLLYGVINPTMDFERNCQILELDCLPINIPCRDGKYIVSAKRGFNLSYIQPKEITSRAESLKEDIVQSPSNPVSITVGPNFIDKDGSVMHSMYSRNRLIHCSSILDAFLPFLEKWKKIDRQDLTLRQRIHLYTGGRDLLPSSWLFPVSDTDLIDNGALVLPVKVGGEPKIVVVQVYGNDLWRYTATSMYYNGSLRKYFSKFKANVKENGYRHRYMDRCEPVYIL